MVDGFVEVLDAGVGGREPVREAGYVARCVDVVMVGLEE